MKRKKIVTVAAGVAIIFVGAHAFENHEQCALQKNQKQYEGFKKEVEDLKEENRFSISEELEQKYQVKLDQRYKNFFHQDIELEELQKLDRDEITCRKSLLEYDFQTIFEEQVNLIFFNLLDINFQNIHCEDEKVVVETKNIDYILDDNLANMYKNYIQFNIIYGKLMEYSNRDYRYASEIILEEGDFIPKDDISLTENKGANLIKTYYQFKKVYDQLESDVLTLSASDLTYYPTQNVISAKQKIK